MKEVVVLKPTEEETFGAFSSNYYYPNLVMVVFHQNDAGHFCVWVNGRDDANWCYVADCGIFSEIVARNKFQQVIGLEFVNYENLIELGFKED